MEEPFAFESMEWQDFFLRRPIGAEYTSYYIKTVYDDWLNGGRLDLILDAIKTETDTHPTLAEIEAGDMATILTETQSHPTLAEIEAGDMASILGYVDALPSDPADESLLEAAITTAHTATDADIATVDTVVDLIRGEINAAALAQGAGSVASSSQLDSLVRAIADILRAGGSGDLPALYEEGFHESFLFPEDSDETVTFTAGGANNTFGNWSEIVDDQAVTLTSKATSELHISSLVAESASATDKVFIYEIGYGVSNTVVARGRILSGNVRISTTQQVHMRNLSIPAGETIKYRLKCETGGENITVAMRYHFH